MLTIMAQRRVLRLLRADHNLQVGTVDVIHTNAGLAVVSPDTVVWARLPMEVVDAIDAADTQYMFAEDVKDCGHAPRRGE